MADIRTRNITESEVCQYCGKQKNPGAIMVILGPRDCPCLDCAQYYAAINLHQYKELKGQEILAQIKLNEERGESTEELEKDLKMVKSLE